MAVRSSQSDKGVIFFITFTCHGWLPLFEETQSYDAIYKWFDYLKKYQNYVVGYVIMPNHVHLMLYVSEKSPTINTLIANGKRFLAYEIISRLQQGGRHEILRMLENAVTRRENDRGKKHRVFEPSFDAKICESKKFILQKLHYMHRNPISGKWNLVEDWATFKHSSAGQYELEKPGAYFVVDFRDLEI